MKMLILLSALVAAEVLPLRSVSVNKQEDEIRLVDRTGRETMIRPQGDEVGFQSPRISPDGRTAVWLTKYPNCCTSYPIPRALVAYRDGKVIWQYQLELMIYEWRFANGGKKIVLSAGTVHFVQSTHMTLLDTQTGRVLQEWDGMLDEKPPAWGAGLRR